MLHIITHAHSINGQHWHRNSETAVPYKLGYAQAFLRSTVIQNTQGSLEMWFSSRDGLGKKYRIS